MIPLQLPICYRCKHLDTEISEKVRCAAFPDSVPMEIIMSQHDHTKPYPGDNGIRFEPIEDEQDNG